MGESEISGGGEIFPTSHHHVCTRNLSMTSDCGQEREGAKIRLGPKSSTTMLLRQKVRSFSQDRQFKTIIRNDLAL